MKKAKKILLLVLCAALLVSASVMGTLAYLTAQTGPITNTMSVGNVAITMDETDVTLYGVKDTDGRVTANDYKLIPGHTYLKDPTIHVTTGSEDCWLFVKIVNEIETIEDGKARYDANDPAETIYTIAGQLEKNGWTICDAQNNIWGKTESAKAGDDVKVFESFKIQGIADVAGYDNATIKVTAYAIQKDGFNSAQDAWNTALAAGHFSNP